MKLGILMTGETPWEELLALCRHAEASGWDSLWYGDHFMPPGGDLEAPVHESWTTLAALAVVPELQSLASAAPLSAPSQNLDHLRESSPA